MRAVVAADRASSTRSATNGTMSTTTIANGIASRRLSFCRMPNLPSIVTLQRPRPDRPSNVDKLLGLEQLAGVHRPEREVARRVVRLAVGAGVRAAVAGTAHDERP